MKNQTVMIAGDNNPVIWKHPESDFGENTKVIVSEGCEAVFVKDGEIFDILRAGETVINEKNRFSKNKGGHNCALFGVNKARVLTGKWGVGDVAYEDYKYKTFISLGAFGTYRYQLGQSVTLFRALGGLFEDITQEKIEKFFFSKVVMAAKNSIAAFIVDKKLSYLEINSRLLQIVEKVTKDLEKEFSGYGVTLLGFTIEGFRFPPQFENTIRQAQQNAFVASLNADNKEKAKEIENG